MAETEAPAVPAKTRDQVVRQHRAVAHLARQIAVIHDQLAYVYGEAPDTIMSPAFIDSLGRKTAGLMETLGDVLNNMDAVDETVDGWLNEVFSVAQATWPQRGALDEKARAELDTPTIP